MNCFKWIDEYKKWFDDNIDIQETTFGCLITTPFLSIDNDYITLRIKEVGDEIEIGDNHFTFEQLFLHDYELNNKRMKEINRILNGLGLSIKNDEIVAYSNIKNFGRMFINVIHGINKTYSLVNTIRATDQKSFRDEILEYFTELKIPFSQRYKIRGVTSEHYFDFMVPKKENILLIDPLSTKSISTARSIAQQLAFKLMDVRDRKQDIKGIAIINDNFEHVWNETDTQNIINHYIDHAYKWNKDREEIKKLIA